MAVLLVAGGYSTYAFYHSAWWSHVGFVPDEPVIFSHRHHVGELHLDCRYCHATVDRAAFAGLPSTETCLSCHSQIFTDTRMLRPVVTSLELNRPLRWNRATRLPNFVFFDHSIHIAKGVSCERCHGNVATMVVDEPRRQMDMRFCLDCHRHSQEFGVQSDHLTNCSTCHR